MLDFHPPLHLIRYDDLCAISNSHVEEALIDVLLRHQLPCTFAAIPFVCDPRDLAPGNALQLKPLPHSKVQLLKPLFKAGLAEIALHGYSHLAVAPLCKWQELTDMVPQTAQRALIQYGRSYLEDTFGVPLRLYVPPWNRLAASTASILQEEGLMLSSTIHANEQPAVLKLDQMPCDVGIRATSAALQVARQLGKAGSVVGTLIHEYDFEESGQGVANLRMRDFESICQHWKKSNRSCLLISDAITQYGKLGYERTKANSDLRQCLSRSLICRLLLRNLKAVYWTTSLARKLKLCVRTLP